MNTRYYKKTGQILESIGSRRVLRQATLAEEIKLTALPPREVMRMRMNRLK